MDTFNCICLGFAIASFGTAMFIHRREHHTLTNLFVMLDNAIKGTLTENTFDESMLSAIEMKMARFLSSHEQSSKNLKYEKNKINELISNISHQTKTPISNIVLYTQLLSESDLPPHCADKIEILLEQANKLNFLVETLTKTSRLEAGIIIISPKLSKVQDVINISVLQSQAKAELKNIRIITKNTDQVAVFDLKWTAEAIHNILDNAIKYSPVNSCITVRVISYEIFCRIDIADEGIGISEDEYSRVFGRFYRSPAVAEYDGVGIGLFLAREIITAVGGYIKVSSNLGRGSVFSVFLQRVE